MFSLFTPRAAYVQKGEPFDPCNEAHSYCLPSLKFNEARNQQTSSEILTMKDTK